MTSLKSLTLPTSLAVAIATTVVVSAPSPAHAQYYTGWDFTGVPATLAAGPIVIASGITAVVQSIALIGRVAPFTNRVVAIVGYAVAGLSAITSAATLPSYYSRAGRSSEMLLLHLIPPITNVVLSSVQLLFEREIPEEPRLTVSPIALKATSGELAPGVMGVLRF